MLFAEKDGLDVFTAVGNWSATGLLAYIVVYWLPRFVKAYREGNKAIAESHHAVIREVSNFWKERGDKMMEMWNKQHNENLRVQSRVAKSMSALIQERHKGRGGDDTRPRES